MALSMPSAFAQTGSYNLVPFIESVNDVLIGFASRDCAYVEGSLGNEICEMPPSWQGDEMRNLLRFSTGVWNKG